MSPSVFFHRRSLLLAGSLWLLSSAGWALTPTNTPTYTWTPSLTPTPNSTQTLIAQQTATANAQATATAVVLSYTRTSTPPPSPTPTLTSTSTASPTATVVPTVCGGVPQINTFAGNGTAGYNNDGITATAASIYSPAGAAFDAAGNLYIADMHNNRIRKVSPGGIISTIAGTGTAGNGGDGLAAVSATVNTPYDVVVDPAGNVYFSDTANNRIRMINTSGIISNFAGSSTAAAGNTGDGGPATSALLSKPAGLAFDASGSLYIVDINNSRVRKVSGGVITNFAGSAAGTGGDSGDGGLATSALLQWPYQIAFDPAGNAYISDFQNNRVRKVGISGTITNFAGSPTGGGGYSGDGGPATSALLANPVGMVMDPYGNLFIGDMTNGAVRMVNPGGMIYTVAGTGTPSFSGDGGPANQATLNSPWGLALDNVGALYICDWTNNRIRIVGCPSGPTITPTRTNTPLGTMTPTWTASPTLSSTPTPVLSATPTVSASPTLSSTPTPVFSATPSWTASPTPSPTDTLVFSATPSWTASPTPSPTDTLVFSATPSWTASPTPSPTDTPVFSATPSWTASPTETNTNSPSFTASASPSVSATPTPSPTGTATIRPSATESGTGTPTYTVSATMTPAPANLDGPIQAGSGGFVFTGTGQPGGTVYVVDATTGNTVLGSGMVGANGTFVVNGSGTISAGDQLVAHSGSSSGPATSGPSVQPSPMGTPAGNPGVPASGGASVVSVGGVAGQTVLVVDLGTGQVLGTGVVPAGGIGAVLLQQSLATGVTVETVFNGQSGPSITVGAPGAAPVFLSGTALTDGSQIYATAPPGSTVQIVDANGHILGQTQAAANGVAAVPVQGGTPGANVYVAANGVKVPLPQRTSTLGDSIAILSTNIFRPSQGPLVITLRTHWDDHLSVKAFNLSGALARSFGSLDVVNGGLYTLLWDGLNGESGPVSSGVYFVSIHGHSTHALMKVVLIR